MPSMLYFLIVSPSRAFQPKRMMEMRIETMAMVSFSTPPQDLTSTSYRSMQGELTARFAKRIFLALLVQ